MVRKLIIICALALAGSFCFAETEEHPSSENSSFYTLLSLYVLSPDNPWHTYLADGGPMPLALRSVKEHLITMDPELEASFEEEAINDTLYLCFAAYFKAQENAWNEVIDHLDRTFEASGSFNTTTDKENTINDIILSLENYIVEPYEGDVTELWEAVLRQIPWFLEGAPAYISELLNPQEESDIEDMEATEAHTANNSPLVLCPSNTEKTDAKHSREQCKESLRKTWETDIKPFLKRTRTEFKNFVKKLKDSSEYRKAKQTFDKVEREVRSFRNEATREIKNYFKKW